MKKHVSILAVVLAVLMAPSIAFGASPWTEQTTTKDQIIHKLDFGARNFLGGWTEIITVPMEYHKNDQNVVKGLANGIWNGIIYTLGGVLHTATFFIPQIDVPLPNNGVQFD